LPEKEPCVTSQNNLALLTDLYQLTMAQSYFQNQKFDNATFSLFIRSYPPNRGFLVSAGLTDVLDFLTEFSFTPHDIDYLHSMKLFADDFLDFLQELRFTGDVWAIPEGRLFFKDEPVLEITAPIIEAQLVETFILNQINLQTLIASKAARCLHAAQGKSLVDFSLRRTHGTDAGLKVARASYLAGFEGTSNVLAGKRYGIPAVGTMAHSFVTTFEREIDAFRGFVASFPEHSTLLIDTYDTVAGAHKAVEIAREMAAAGKRLRGVRIDSGDLASLAREVRSVLDQAGFPDVKIVGSGGLDEYKLQELSEAKVPYDSYGVGTKMGVSGDAPWFDIAYKLVEYNGRSVLKLSTGKISWPGKKQVFRFADESGRWAKDIIALRRENLAGGLPLLKNFMAKGKVQQSYPPLKEIRESFLQEFARLPDKFKALRDPTMYSVELSPQLAALKNEMEREVARTETHLGLGES
jgi:nicotinate phosphoribosyltransferase